MVSKELDNVLESYLHVEPRWSCCNFQQCSQTVLASSNFLSSYLTCCILLLLLMCISCSALNLQAACQHHAQNLGLGEVPIFYKPWTQAGNTICRAVCLYAVKDEQHHELALPFMTAQDSAGKKAPRCAEAGNSQANWKQPVLKGIGPVFVHTESSWYNKTFLLPALNILDSLWWYYI